MIAGELSTENRVYTTIVKALATADLDIMDLICRWQEITKMQCELIQEKKSIDHKLDCRIFTKFRLEQQKADILPHVKIPSAHVASPNIPKHKIVPKLYPCVIRKVTKRPSKQDNHKSKVCQDDNSDDSLSDRELLSYVQDSS